MFYEYVGGEMKHGREPFLSYHYVGGTEHNMLCDRLSMYVWVCRLGDVKC